MRRRVMGGLLTVAMTVALGVGILPAGSAQAAAVPYETVMTSAKIPTRDGVTLDAKIWSPKGVTGRAPLMVMPSSWGGASGDLLWQAEKFAQRGFVSVNYAPRGFKDSGGLVELAGRQDITDVTDIIDWSVVHANADAGRVGMWGLSYGAGLSLVAAAFEPRLKAVGSIEGWADLSRTAYPNQTRSTFVTAFLIYGAVIAGRLSPDIDSYFHTLLTGEQPTGTEMQKALAAMASRSPANMIDAINRNGAAVFMANSWNDIAYGTDQLFPFWSRLTAPKRIEVRPGDHVVNELPNVVEGGAPQLESVAPGVVGVGTSHDLFPDLYDWMSSYVAGKDTALVHQPAVNLFPRSSGPRPAKETYPSVAAMTTGARTLQLTAPSGIMFRTGAMTTRRGTTQPGTAWSTTIRSGGDVAGGLGVPVVNFAQEALTGVPPRATLFLTDRNHSALWVGPAEKPALHIRGNTTIRTTIVPSAAKGTLVAYLYDTDAAAPGGTGYLISHRPYSFSGATPGRPIELTLPLQPTAYDLPAGHRLAIGISTSDPVYADENPSGASLKLTSTVSRPMQVTVETGR